MSRFSPQVCLTAQTLLRVLSHGKFHLPKSRSTLCPKKFMEFCHVSHPCQLLFPLDAILSPPGAQVLCCILKLWICQISSYILAELPKLPILLQDLFLQKCELSVFLKDLPKTFYFPKGGYKQILGIEGNSSIATDMSVWDGVSAINLVWEIVWEMHISWINQLF